MKTGALVKRLWSLVARHIFRYYAASKFLWRQLCMFNREMFKMKHTEQFGCGVPEYIRRH